MARFRDFLVIFLIYSTSCVVKSAPSQPSGPPAAASSLEHDIQELSHSESLRQANNSSNSSKSPSVGSNIGSQEVVEVGKDASKDKVKHPGGMDVKTTGAPSNVMTLSDDVITDALFTNIDTLQDHLEVCEEGLRQQLRLHSHGKLLQEVAAEERDYTATKGAVTNNGNENDDNFEDGEDDDDGEDAEDVDTAGHDNEKDIGDEINDEIVTDNKDGATSANIKIPPDSKPSDVRRRRSLTGSPYVKQTPRKADLLAQKVVSRLSGRLEYLKASLIQCHLLYKQFGLL